ncbi:MAG: DUF3617 family protein [Casimicrobiaceae bacterium]
MRSQSSGLAVAALAAAMFGGEALAAEPPVLKSGLWEVTRANPQQPPDRRPVTTMCLDESVQAQMREFGMGATKEMCSQNERKVESNRMTMSATCKLGQTTMKTQSVMTFASNTAYHMEGTASYDPPMPNMPRESKTSVDAKWVGPCKAGQQPGDVTLETGQTINIKQMMGGGVAGSVKPPMKQ